jgi:CRP-like cAMP-binding protein
MTVKKDERTSTNKGSRSPELVSFLSSIFEDLTEGELRKLGDSALLVDYSQGDLIIQEGAPFSGVYIVYHGLVCIGKYSSSRKRRCLRFLASGEFFGLEALFMERQQANIQFARALLDSELIFIRDDLLLDFFNRHPRSMLTLCRWFAREVAMLEFKLTREATEGSLHNLAMLLSALSNKYGHPTPSGTIIDLRLPRYLMAEMLGISEDTLLKLLKKLKDRQVISVQDANITIINKGKLDELALTAGFYLTILEETL